VLQQEQEEEEEEKEGGCYWKELQKSKEWYAAQKNLAVNAPDDMQLAARLAGKDEKTMMKPPWYHVQQRERERAVQKEKVVEVEVVEWMAMKPLWYHVQ
jgi:hypothetical protein